MCIRDRAMAIRNSPSPHKRDAPGQWTSPCWSLAARMPARPDNADMSDTSRMRDVSDISALSGRAGILAARLQHGEVHCPGASRLCGEGEFLMAMAKWRNHPYLELEGEALDNHMMAMHAVSYTHLRAHETVLDL